MKNHLHILITISLLLFSVEASAIKAGRDVIKYRQPNGTVILLRSYGDEFLGYSKTLNGFIVSKGKDGYLYYANYNSGTLSITTERVAGSKHTTNAIGATGIRHTSIPANIVAQLRERAFESLNGGITAVGSSIVSSSSNSSLRRQQYNTEEPDNEQTKHVSSLVLLVDFPDRPFSINNPAEYFNTLLNGHALNGSSGSAADYLNSNFGKGYNFTFDLDGIFTTSKEAEYYGGRTATTNDANIPALVEEVCMAASNAGVDFSKYDSNGDGTVDNVAIIFAGCNEAESANPSLIWPHKGDISGRNIVCNGVKIGSYTCSSELSGSETEPREATIGIFCHEYLHSWGLPDLYDVNSEEEGLARALYKSLSIMDEGYYSNQGKTPPYLTSIEREILALHPVKDITAGENYTLLPVQHSDTLYRIPTSNEGEYFLLECRNAGGWDNHIGGEGMLLYHIDKSQNECGGVSAARRWELNIINSYANHECAKVIAANPYAPDDASKAEVFYPGISSVTNISAIGSPKLASWQGHGLGISLQNISYKNGRVNFNAISGINFNSTLPVATSIKTTPYQHSVLLQWTQSHQLDQQESSSVSEDDGWYISISKKDTLLPPVELHTKDLYCVLKSLDIDSEYSGTVNFIAADSMSKAVSFSFSTEKESSPYPHLKLLGKYKIDDIACFEVQNLTEPVKSVVVKINGVNLKEPYYQFKDSGEYTVEIRILYPDSSTDIITKRITVE